MNQTNILKNYTLSRYTVEKLKVIKEKLKEDINQADPLWKTIMNREEETCMNNEESTDESEEHDNSDLANMPDHTLFNATQFYFTQCNNTLDTGVKHASIQKMDILECLYEELERSNGKLDLNQLENLVDEELEEIVCELEKKLSITGTYNLCCSMNSMTLDQRIKYATTFCSHLLLPKIIALEEPSRLLLSGVTECVQKFPDDIRKLIFIPLLNVDLKDTSVVNAIASAFESQRNTLITDFVSHVKELKLWHFPILHNLMSFKTDVATSDKLVQLLSEKALDFAKDKNYGKLVLSFIKINGNFTGQQKDLLCEIANVNQTLFKKPMQNVLKTM